ncbi:MAG TPA: exopolysaccharide biosynthesis polyprenyl glycosylphosphotransferase [Afifellaceae bacterium]|nr:exopolysaccharide biosynthesis polyprenyl glycosylphosphotransferase [Afifellaceae bacterium]
MVMLSIAAPAPQRANFGELQGRQGGWLRLATGWPVQLLGGLCFGAVVPVLLRWPFEIEQLTSSSPRNTLAGTAVAVTAGYLLLRRLCRFPGIRSTSYIGPAFAVVYGLLVAALLFTRMDYARLQMASSFLLTLTWFYWVCLVEQRVRRPRLAVLPIGETADLFAIRSIDWLTLNSPNQALHGCDGIVADLRGAVPPQWEKFLACWALRGMPVYHVKQVGESLTGRVQIEHLSENTLGSLLPSSVYARVKRAVDLMGAFVLLPVVLPLVAAAALAIRLDSPGPVLFRQQRMGYRGDVFTIYKFRTMHCDRSEGRHFTVGDDPRVTRVGRLLRRYRIDELPQIVNILKGEMSWIGPRPEAVSLSEWYEREIPFYCYRHIVRPGITGWAQVQQGYAAKIKAVTSKLHYDFYYIKNFSPWLDLLIAAKTVRTVLSGFGAR